jgi:hypothetical protein
LVGFATTGCCRSEAPMRLSRRSATIAGMPDLRRAAPGTPEGLLREAPGRSEPTPAGRSAPGLRPRGGRAVLRATLAKLEGSRCGALSPP